MCYNYAVAVYPDSPRVRPGQHDRRPDRHARTEPHQPTPTRRSTLSADGATGAVVPGTAAWRCGARTWSGCCSLRLARRPDQTGHARPVICRLVSAAGQLDGRFGAEACPTQADLRLTLLRPADGGRHAQPEIRAAARRRRRLRRPRRSRCPIPPPPSMYPARSRRSTSSTRPAKRPSPALLVPKPPSPNATHVARRRSDHWWTGDSLMVFSANGLRYRYTVSRVGRQHSAWAQATMMAGRLLVPVTGGYDVFDPATGSRCRTHPAATAARVPLRWCPRWPVRRSSSSADDSTAGCAR